MLECLKELFISGGEDPWAKEILRIEQESGGVILGSTLNQISRSIMNVAALSVLESKRSKGSLNAMPQPRFWFKMQGHVGDSCQSKTLNLARAGNLRLGNRMANIHGKQWKICPWCFKEGFTVRLAETHVILSCRVVKAIQQREGISKYCSTQLRHGEKNWHRILCNYLGQDRADWTELHQRGASINHVLVAWLGKTKDV